jgi:(1->4)-alpha-D-glucan 1-alpha-D-glucosylmutase
MVAELTLPAVPSSTYRVQFGPRFHFTDGARIVPYLAALGAGCLYASPYFRARPGSEHGYDVVDHNRLNPEIGEESEQRAMIAQAQAAGLAHLVDFVPNHMGIGADNPWWTDVLTLGRRSAYAHFFDIDWQARTLGRGKVVLPFLGDHYGAVVERGELEVTFDPTRGTFALRYYDHTFPLAPHTYAMLFTLAAARNVPEREADLRGLALAFESLRSRSRDTPRRRRQRDRAAALSAEIAERCARDPGFASVLAETATRVSADPDRLDALLAAQYYRLVFWRAAADEINYRRFFDINDLAGLRVEDAEVLARTHALLFTMISDGRIQGVRVDHIDGLANPGGYVNLLVDYATALDRSLYVVVEKILADGERLRPTWRIAGTTGYEFMNLVAGVFVDASREEIFDRIYRRVLGRRPVFAEEAYAAKRRVMRIDLGSELQVLAEALARIARCDRRSNDFTTIGLRRALTEVVAALPVYRTYVIEDEIEPDDRSIIAAACARARNRSELADDGVFAFIHEVLTLELLQIAGSRYDRVEVVSFVMRFQQYTGPVMAKSIEDTAFYRYVRLTALNEVGGDPSRFGRSVAELHAANAERARAHPHGMLSTAPHDHKRGEDTRLRIAALTEFPAEWSRAVARWARINASLRDSAAASPSPTDEYLFYQTVVGTLPPNWLGETGPDAAQAGSYAERLVAYATKAAREAKLSTSWSDVNAAYEAGLASFVAGALAPDAPYLRDACVFTAALAPIAAIHGLAQVTLKLTVPGVPDVYQGCELWDHSLVDPDNRRPVDYDARSAILDAVAARSDRAALVDELLATWPDGRIKLYLTWRLLALRRGRPQAFDGAYRPLVTADDGLIAYARGDDVVVIVPRLTRRRWLGETLRVGYDDAHVVGLPPATRYRNALDDTLLVTTTGGSLAAGTALARAPVAVLIPEA